MTQPVRLRLSRRRGFDLQALSLATNGLPAVVVSRPSRWGNPYPVNVDRPAEQAVEAYAAYLDRNPDLVRDARRELSGKNLACWCGASSPCHADVLLRIAAAEEG